MTNKVNKEEVLKYFKKHGINETIQKFKISYAIVKRLQKKYNIKPISTKTDRTYLHFKNMILKDLKNKKKHSLIQKKYNLGNTVFYNVLKKLKEENLI